MQAQNSAIIAAEEKRPISGGNRAVLSLGLGYPEQAMNAFQEMVRRRLRERTPNYSALASFLGVDPSIIQKRFKDGGTALCLDFLESVTAFYQMSVSEMTALPGSAWQEIKPLEGQLLAIFREMTELERRGLLDVLDRSARAVPAHKRRRAKAGHAPLTEEQQQLIELFSRSEPHAREGVLKILRGSAKQSARRPPAADTAE